MFRPRVPPRFSRPVRPAARARPHRGAAQARFGTGARTVPVPTYAFQRRSHWIGAPADRTANVVDTQA
ncbi:hypothetical protein [Streptomyces sp. A30]|uniref:hypothetical protein n=1 Tax=Streptomyces sp. A30 TaxID=2789273 RepID=UPI00398026C7